MIAVLIISFLASMLGSFLGVLLYFMWSDRKKPLKTVEDEEKTNAIVNDDIRAYYDKTQGIHDW